MEFGEYSLRQYRYAKDYYRIVQEELKKHLINEDELVSLYNNIKKEAPEIPIVMIEDNGLTEFHGVKTKTCIGIGPWVSEEIDKFTKHLKLL